jgi:hypothetical protein
MPQKMLVGDKDTVLLIPAFEVNGVPRMALPSTAASQPIDDPTSALLNYWIDVLTPGDTGAHWGGNITCSVIDDWNLALTDSATDDTRTLCSVGQSQDLTFYNYDAVMNFLRDVDPLDATSEFNLPLNLLIAPDLAYVIAHRVGYGHTENAAVGQEWHFYYVWTDHTIPASSDGDNLALGQTFIPKGLINFKHELDA